MPVTRERFAQGMTYEQFKAQMTRNQERFAANERRLELTPDDLAAFERLPRPLDVLVLAEDWCGDVIDNLPILGRLAEASGGKLNPRIFLRDKHPDLMDQYLNDGKFRSIPVFVFFDEHFKELGHFIERPASVTARRAAQRQAIYAEHPEFGSPQTPIADLPEATRAELSQALMSAREQFKPVENQEVVSALRAIVERAQA